jgi:hypothetical protein
MRTDNSRRLPKEKPFQRSVVPTTCETYSSNGAIGKKAGRRALGMVSVTYELCLRELASGATRRPRARGE